MENSITKIEDFNVNALTEIKGKTKMITKIIKENPFIEIIDNATFDFAKKNRTALRTCRTEFEEEFEAKKTDLITILESKKLLLQKVENQRIATEKSNKVIQEQKTKTFEFIAKRLSEIGFVLSDDATEFHNKTTGSFTVIDVVSEATESDFEEILSLIKQLIEKIKSLPVTPDDCFFENDPELTKANFEVKPFMFNEAEYIAGIDPITKDIKTIIFNTINSLCSNFLFYDRKEDEDLSFKELNEAVKNGSITVGEMVSEFKKHLDNTFKNE